MSLRLELQDYFSFHYSTATFKQVKIYLVKFFVFFLEEKKIPISLLSLCVHGENCDPQDEYLLVVDINKLNINLTYTDTDANGRQLTLVRPH